MEGSPGTGNQIKEAARGKSAILVAADGEADYPKPLSTLTDAANNLTITDQERVQLQNLKLELDRMSLSAKAAYSEVLSKLSFQSEPIDISSPDLGESQPNKSPNVLSDHTFDCYCVDRIHLQFIRASGEDIQAAASRIVAYFAHVNTMLRPSSSVSYPYGLLSNERPRLITQDLLNAQDLVVLNSGGIQILYPVPSGQPYLFLRPETCWNAMLADSGGSPESSDTKSIANLFSQCMVRKFCIPF